MAAKPLPYVILDEEDKFEWSTKETTPPNLVRKRLTRFSHMSKLWRFSSPAVESGPIWKALNEECDVIFGPPHRRGVRLLRLVPGLYFALPGC